MCIRDSYMSDRVDRELLTTIQNKLEESKSQDLKMSQQSLAEALFQRKWYNPFPKYKFTERPDTACACLMEGKVIILTAVSYTHLDVYKRQVHTSYLRFSLFLSLSFPPLFL